MYITEKRDGDRFEKGELIECVGISVSCIAEQEKYARGERRSPLEVGKVYEVTGTSEVGSINFVSVRADGVYVNGTYAAQFKRVSNKPFMPNVISTIKKITRREPEKSFVKAGFMDENENVTDEGSDALIYILWEQNKTELKKLADQINEEIAPKKK